MTSTKTTKSQIKPEEWVSGWTSDHSALIDHMMTGPSAQSLDEYLTSMHKKRRENKVSSLNLNAGSPVIHPAFFASGMSIDHLKVLIKHGLDPKAQFVSFGKWTGTLLHDTCLKLPIEKIVEISGLDIDSGKDHYYEQPIHTQARHGNINALRSLLAMGADVNAADQRGMTPIMCVAALGSCQMNTQAMNAENTQMIDMLIKHGADIEARDQNGLTAMHHAAKSANLAKLQALLKHGADLEAQDKMGLRPVHHALKEECITSAYALIAIGASAHGVYSSKHYIHNLLHGSKLICALACDDLSLLQTHLEMFPSIERDEFERLTKELQDEGDTQRIALLQAHTSMQQIKSINGLSRMAQPGA